MRGKRPIQHSAVPAISGLDLAYIVVIFVEIYFISSIVLG